MPGHYRANLRVASPRHVVNPTRMVDDDGINRGSRVPIKLTLQAVEALASKGLLEDDADLERRIDALEGVRRQSVVIRNVLYLGAGLPAASLEGLKWRHDVHGAAGARVDVTGRLRGPVEALSDLSRVCPKSPQVLVGPEREGLADVLEQHSPGAAHLSDELVVVRLVVAARTRRDVGRERTHLYGLWDA